MGIMSDEPLIDDTELDDFDWDQHVTSGGNMDDDFYTPEQLREMSREHALQTIGHLIAMRLVEIEPAYAASYDSACKGEPPPDEDVPLPTTTEEGEFLSLLLGITHSMREPECNPEE